MADFNIADVSEKNTLVQKLKKELEKVSRQTIEIINIGKVSRQSGTSVLPIEMVFSGNQTALFLVRQGGDVFRVKINGKDFPINGDLSLDGAKKQDSKNSSEIRKGGAGFAVNRTFSQVVEDIGAAIINGQKTFEKQLERKKVAPPPNPNRVTPKNVAQQTKELQQKDSELQSELDQRNQRINVLKTQLEQLDNR